VTITLRPLVAEDAAWLDTWLVAVAASVGYSELTQDEAGKALFVRAGEDNDVRARIIERDGADVGLIVWRRRGADAAIIEFVGTPPLQARRGSGMAAAALIEREMRDAGVRAIFAPAPAVHGIAMYFWIRLGYRPLLQSDWPCVREGVAWLRRDL
jgi:hypothetical protein